MPSAATDGGVRFGVVFDGLRLLTPADRPAQYLAAAAIFPLPLAPRRLRGLTQVRGHPVSVLDAAPQAPSRLPTLQRHALLIVGDPAQSPIGLLVDGPPSPLQIVEPPDAAADAATHVPPDVAFASVLGTPLWCRDPQGGDPAIWWQADYSALFEALMADQ